LLVNTYGPGRAFSFLSRATARLDIARISISIRFILLLHIGIHTVLVRC